MPNGGTAVCAYCQNFNRSLARCELRGVAIPLPPGWTTCRNYFGPDDEPDGPLCSIVCMVTNEKGSYAQIPYFDGIRVEAVQTKSGNSVLRFMDKKGTVHEFPSVEEYMLFYKQHSSKE